MSKFCDLNKNIKHIGEVSTSRVDGSPTGAEILTSTNAVTGDVRDTLDGKLKKMDQQFQDRFNTLAPTPWTPNTLIKENQSLQVFEHEGLFYLPNVKKLPFTTGAVFNADNWVLSELMTQMKHWRDVGDVRGWGVVADAFLFLPSRLAASVSGVAPIINPNATDNTANIQKAIDDVIYNPVSFRKNVILPCGGIAISKTLHLGYGDRFSSVILRGAGTFYRPEELFRGTAIVCKHSDSPAINFQGSRESLVESLSLVGLAYQDLKDRNVGGLQDTGYERFDERHYESSGLSANAYSETAPYAGITVDAYSGNKPAISYPDVNYPSYASQDQWGKAVSNKPRLRDVSIQGFAVAVCTHPSGSDGQGDFLSLDNCQLSFNQYGVSISQTQSRLVNISNSFIENCHTAIVNNKHGMKSGKFGGVISNTSFDRIGYLMDISGGVSGGTSFISCYGELVGSLGFYCKDNAIQAFPLIFNGGEFNFSERVNNSYAQPTHHFETGSYAAVTLENVALHVRSFFNTTGLVELEQSLVVPIDTLSGEGMAVCVNANGGFISSLTLRQPSQNKFRFKSYDRNTSTWDGQRIAGGKQKVTQCGREKSISTHSTGFFYDVDSYAPEYSFWQNFTALQCELSPHAANIKVNLKYTGTNPILGIGDLVQIQNGGDVQYFYVESGIYPDFVCARIGGYKEIGGGTTVQTPTFTSGVVTSLISRLYYPASVFLGTLTKGSTTITNCGRPDSYFAGIASKIKVGDHFFVTEQTYRPFFKSAKIVSIDEANRTVTVDTPAQISGEIRMPILMRS